MISSIVLKNIIRKNEIKYYYNIFTNMYYKISGGEWSNHLNFGTIVAYQKLEEVMNSLC